MKEKDQLSPHSKIALISDILLETTGGIPTVIWQTKQLLEAEGHQVVLIAPARHQQADPQIITVPTRWWTINQAPVAKSPTKILRWLERHHPELASFDLFHIHYEGACSIAGQLLAKKHRIPIVQTMHGREDMAIMFNIPKGLRTLVAWILSTLHAHYLPHAKLPARIANPSRPVLQTLAQRYMWRLMVAQANAASLVISPSEHFRKKLLLAGVTTEIIVAGGGASTEIFQAKWPERQWKEGEPLRLLWHSRISKEKRALAAVQGILAAPFPIQLEMFSTGNQLKAIKQAIAKQPESKAKIILHGKRPRIEIIRAMRRQHAIVMMSDNFDTQGLTIVEAAAAGLPVIYCDPDMNEIIPEGGGICNKNNTPEALTRTLAHLKNNREKIAEMSQVILEQRENTDGEKKLRQVLAIYAKAIRQTKEQETHQ